jgi:hypothetical protein
MSFIHWNINTNIYNYQSLILINLEINIMLKTEVLKRSKDVWCFLFLKTLNTLNGLIHHSVWTKLFIFGDNFEIGTEGIANISDSNQAKLSLHLWYCFIRVYSLLLAGWLLRILFLEKIGHCMQGSLFLH